MLFWLLLVVGFGLWILGCGVAIRRSLLQKVASYQLSVIRPFDNIGFLFTMATEYRQFTKSCDEEIRPTCFG